MIECLICLNNKNKQKKKTRFPVWKTEADFICETEVKYKWILEIAKTDAIFNCFSFSNTEKITLTHTLDRIQR